jgi:hypothetical protein
MRVTIEKVLAHIADNHFSDCRSNEHFFYSAGRCWYLEKLRWLYFTFSGYAGFNNLRAQTIEE